MVSDENMIFYPGLEIFDVWPAWYRNNSKPDNSAEIQRFCWSVFWSLGFFPLRHITIFPPTPTRKFPHPEFFKLRTIPTPWKKIPWVKYPGNKPRLCFPLFWWFFLHTYYNWCFSVNEALPPVTGQKPRQKATWE